WRYQDIGAVFSQVPLGLYSEAAFHEKIENDLAWIDKKARKHTYIMEQIHENHDLIPLQFCTIYKDSQSIDHLLREHYTDFKQLLSKVKGNTEWTIKVYCQEEKLLEKQKKEQAATMKAALDEPHRGKAYLMKKKMESSIHANLRDGLLSKLELIVGTIKKRFQFFSAGECYDGDVAGSAGKMVYNCAILAPRGNTADVIEIVDKLNEAVYHDALRLELSGPWPPYSFTSLEL
ncbi:MAG: GvpL/GvpF family gas vesicle protein, partial [Bacillota bacterium]